MELLHLVVVHVLQGQPKIYVLAELPKQECQSVDFPLVGLTKEHAEFTLQK